MSFIITAYLNLSSSLLGCFLQVFPLFCWAPKDLFQCYEIFSILAYTLIKCCLWASRQCATLFLLKKFWEYLTGSKVNTFEFIKKIKAKLLCYCLLSSHQSCASNGTHNDILHIDWKYCSQSHCRSTSYLEAVYFYNPKKKY